MEETASVNYFVLYGTMLAAGLVLIWLLDIFLKKRFPNMTESARDSCKFVAAIVLVAAGKLIAVRVRGYWPVITV